MYRQYFNGCLRHLIIRKPPSLLRQIGIDQATVVLNDLSTAHVDFEVHATCFQAQAKPTAINFHFVPILTWQWQLVFLSQQESAIERCRSIHTFFDHYHASIANFNGCIGFGSLACVLYANLLIPNICGHVVIHSDPLYSVQKIDAYKSLLGNCPLAVLAMINRA